MHNTTLKDRILWFDGDSTFSPEAIVDNIRKGISTEHMFVDVLSPDIAKYNLAVPPKKQITVKEGLKPLSFEWNIPDEYKKIDVISYIIDKLQIEYGDVPDIELREQRCAEELTLYKKLGLFSTIQALIYIIDTLQENNVVWGVGRGSSVASYVLYILGVHDIDSFYYALDMSEFLRE